MKRTKRKRQWHYWVAAGLLIGLLIFLKLHHKPATAGYITSYEDSNGYIYQCSKPLKAKPGIATTLGHPQGPVPYNDADAIRYCHSIGIE